ncbi:sugar kinase [Paractinoplanes abujensis]|uniref:Putative NBD/HSP70 family sugar kinase n=1 Tax=Paractinoplanes abujensis TaxID=882441 RepID=A0A7W7CST8_9ACTN|nr:ROK family protein [Actinoplanes abujensis]MBB4693709.1 putative NBD/HSP70 family sugar kinase [Actinoplanes abujensis]GID21634.1 sugar kinase [Actinoplanes abujensis]
MDSAGAVLRAVLDHGPVARSSVARATRLSAASISGVATSLLSRGLIREAPEAAGRPGIGRPTVPLVIDAEAVAVIGVHIAVPHATVALLDLRGRVIEQHREPHAGRDPASVLDRVAERIGRLRRRRRVLGVGVATGGWVDAVTGTVVEHPALGWRDVPVAATLSRATRFPVRVDSNSRALLRAEQLFGAVAGRARQSAVHLFAGNVVDVAFATGGVVHQGPRSAAGAVAHLNVEGCTERCSCGRTGCLQAAVSEQTLVRRSGATDLLALVTAAQEGDARALGLFHERARLVGRAAALLLDLFDPEVLVVAEAGANRVPACLATLRAEVAAWSAAGADVARVVHATSFPTTVLAVAGGAVALDHIYAQPLSPARI